jgi:glutamine amidotransferase
MMRRLGYQAVITSDAASISSADKIILPGVGAFDNGMRNIRERGLEEVLSRKALEDKVPILGICLGMQLLTRGSEEGREKGLGWIQGFAERFSFSGENSSLKIPHMGWNEVRVENDCALSKDFLAVMRFYFVHSYHVVCDRSEDVFLSADYGGMIAAAIRHDNIMGTQFHPEKSHKYGMIILKNFAEM